MEDREEEEEGKKREEDGQKYTDVSENINNIRLCTLGGNKLVEIPCRTNSLSPSIALTGMEHKGGECTPSRGREKGGRGEGRREEQRGRKKGGGQRGREKGGQRGREKGKGRREEQRGRGREERRGK